jgi:transcriptional regulator with XRE-family HTH domain
MSDIANINWYASSDTALLKIIGEFVKHHRLAQNKTQLQLAKNAGINRSTLSAIENGQPSNTLTLIQVLRVLNQLLVLKEFKVEETISPMLLAEMQQKMRKRARKKTTPKDKPKSDW